MYSPEFWIVNLSSCRCHCWGLGSFSWLMMCALPRGWKAAKAPLQFIWHSYPMQVFGLQIRRRSPGGHWWLIFSALIDCVSNGALIAFVPPHCKQAPKQSIQIPRVSPERGGHHSDVRKGLMCNLKSIAWRDASTLHGGGPNTSGPCRTPAKTDLGGQGSLCLTAGARLSSNFNTVLNMRFIKVSRCLSLPSSYSG